MMLDWSTGVELFVEVPITLIISITLCRIFYNATFYHKNFRILLINYPAAFVFICSIKIITKCMTIFSYRGPVRGYLTDLISVAFFSTTFTTIGFILERSVALIYYYKYENFCNNIPYIGIILIVISWIIGAILRILNRIYNLNVFLFIYSSSIIQITSQIVCFCIIKASKKQYTLNKSINSRLENIKYAKYSIISIKYQTIENRKIIKMMSYFIASTTITTTLDMIALGIENQFFFYIPNKTLRGFIGNFVPYLKACTVPVTVVFVDERLKKILISFMGNYIGKIINRGSITPDAIMKDSNLKNELTMTNDKLNEIYFSNYATQWK
uniref:G-protein coupled receptors family 1 profile domain-containing protein n=2 Tax=Strongyloides stercoralis TaxID=6248 RepID=A0AAF5CVN8_STRER